jgi:restriction system protein
MPDARLKPGKIRVHRREFNRSLAIVCGEFWITNKGSGMARRSKNSTFEDLVLIASRLPWWLCLILAAFAWFGLHALAMRPIAPPTPPINLSTVIMAQLVRTAASAAQYLVPMLLVAGALVSIAGR